MNLPDIIQATRHIRTEAAIRATSNELLAWVAVMPEHPLSNEAYLEIHRRAGTTPHVITKTIHTTAAKLPILLRMKHWNKKLLQTIADENKSELWRECANEMLNKTK
jgi:hypothetical protein